MAWDAIAVMVGGEKISMFSPFVGGMVRFVTGAHLAAFAHSLRRRRTVPVERGSVSSTWIHP